MREESCCCPVCRKQDCVMSLPLVSHGSGLSGGVSYLGSVSEALGECITDLRVKAL